MTMHGEDNKTQGLLQLFPLPYPLQTPPVHVNQTICLFVCGCYMVIISNISLSRMYKLQGNTM